jgi:hypothetical protein
MPVETTSGLRGDGSTASTVPDIAWAEAAGTAQAITAVYDPEITELTDGLCVAFRAAAANTGAAPTFSPGTGITARNVVKRFNTALVANDIVLGGEYMVRYNLANTRWVLLNPVVN